MTDFRQGNAEAKSRVQRFDQEGRFLGSFETDPMPGGLALDKDGLLYVTHMMKHKVAVYDPAGKLVREFGKQGSAPGEFDQPGGIAFGRDGSVYVADQANRRVQRLSPQGEPMSAWGKYGTATGEFGGNSSPRGRGGGPHFLAFNSQGDLYTTEASVGRVQKFKPDGTFLLAWGDNEVGPGHFGGHKYNARSPGHRGRPPGSGVGDLDEPLRTSVHARKGASFAEWAEKGSEPGQFRIAPWTGVRQPALFVCCRCTELQDSKTGHLRVIRAPGKISNLGGGHFRVGRRPKKCSRSPSWVGCQER